MPFSPFRAGRKLIASEFNAAIDNAITTKYQTSDQTRNNSTAMLASTFLVFPMLANAIYTFDIVVFYSSGTTPDFKWEWELPAGSGVLLSGWGNASTTSAIDSPLVHNATSTFPIVYGGIGAGSIMCAIPCGAIATAGTAGNATFRFAQNTANVSDTKLHAGSFAQMSRVA